LREAAEEAGERLARQAVRNPIPRSFARAVEIADPDDIAKIRRRILPDWLTHLGAPGSTDVFITAAADIRHIKTAKGLAKRLTLLDQIGNLKQGPFVIFEFDLDRSVSIATPILRNYPGFVGGGRTLGGAREFVVPNLPLSALRNLRWRAVF